VGVVITHPRFSLGKSDMADSTVTTLQLDPDTSARVQRLAEARHRSAEGLMQEAVQHCVAREEALGQAADGGHPAWVEYQATGLHLTFEEADAWLARLEAGEDVLPPECHV